MHIESICYWKPNKFLKQKSQMTTTITGFLYLLHFPTLDIEVRIY